MGLFIGFLLPFIPSLIVHSIIISELVQRNQTGLAFLRQYATWGLACPLALAAGLALLFGLLHTGPGWLLGVFVVMMLVVACVACFLSWSIVLAVHFATRWFVCRQ